MFSDVLVWLAIFVGFIVSLKNHKTKVAILCLFLLFVGLSVIHDDFNHSTSASSDKQAVSQKDNNAPQNKEDAKKIIKQVHEHEKEQKEKQNKPLSTTEQTMSKIKVGMTVEDYQNVKEKDIKIKESYIPNDPRLKGEFYKTRDGYVFIAANGKTITDVKSFKTLDEGKKYTDDKSAELDAKENDKKEDAKPKVDVSKENAVSKAKDYINYDAFSQKGLIDQLKFDGFSVEDATYAVNHINVDWNEQAFKKGKEYMDYDSFSRSGLIEQLESEGFTPEQATYAVNKIGL